jgi:hypothetical protein
MYFTLFPKINYLFNISGREHLRELKDITVNVRARAEILSNIELYELYVIKDGETPEKIANKIYGNPNLHWIIMLVNEKFDLWEDFPLSDNQLEQRVLSLYGPNQRDSQHIIFGNPHYETLAGNIVAFDTPNAHSVSNWDYEFKLNESKRTIKIVNPDLVDKFVSELEALVK